MIHYDGSLEELLEYITFIVSSGIHVNNSEMNEARTGPIW